MQPNILILWLGAFGFAVAKHLGENNPEQLFYASEVNTEIFESIQATRKHPYFFEWTMLPSNIQLIENIREMLPETDIIISVIPCQFVWWAFESMKTFLKAWVTILNLSKWIDNQSLQTISEKLAKVLSWQEYHYSYLAGGMIAQEVIDGKKLGADIVSQEDQSGNILKALFHSQSLDIKLKIWNPKNTELYAALKNIIALILGYYEGQWLGASSLGYYFSKLLSEIRGVISLLDGEREIDFTDYALSGDLIATCFGASRNRLLGNMLGKWQDIEFALAQLREQKKIAEGYETLKWVYKITQNKEWFEEINKFSERFL